MSLQIAMTADGRVLYLEDNGSLRACFVHKDLSVDKLLYVCRQGQQCFLQTLGPVTKWYDLRNKKVTNIRPLDGITIVSHSLNLYNISIDGIYLDFDWSGSPTFASSLEGDVGLYRFLSVDDYKYLLKAMSYQWVCGPAGRVATIDLHRSNVREINIGNVKVNYDQLLQALPHAEETGELLLNEDWKVWRFVRYNPLIVIEAYGADEAAELVLSLKSLNKTDNYHGSVFILTDQDVSSLKETIRFYPGNVTFFDVADSKEVHDYFPRARLVKDCALLDHYAPILFCTSGVLFGENICRFLEKSALLRQVESLDYAYHPEFSESQEEKTKVMALLPQEYGSLMLVPNMQAHRLYLDGAMGLFEACLKSYPKEILRFDGQAIINYALRRIRDFSSNFLPESVLTGYAPDNGERADITCFAITEKKRSEQMEACLHALSNAETSKL